MPKLVPTNKFVEDLEAFRRQAAMRKKIAKAMSLLESNPLHPGLHIERIVNDVTAWSVRVDRHYRLSFDPEEYLPSGNPDWSKPVLLLRILDHDDLYKHPR
jgi:Txe/YoeB family toxin of Txe-Axe toxin-antitoxin module